MTKVLRIILTCYGMILQLVVYRAVGKMKNGLVGSPMKPFLGFITLTLVGFIPQVILKIAFGSFQKNWVGFGPMKMFSRIIVT